MVNRRGAVLLFLASLALVVILACTNLPHYRCWAGTRPYLYSSKVAVIVEPRLLRNLVPVIENFATTLPTDWRLQLFLSAANAPVVRASPTLQEWISCGRILFHSAPNIQKYPEDYNRLLLSEAFWKAIRGEHILIFQADSVLCKSSPHHIDDFLQYDYVGALWASAPHLPCGNGGLSIRTKTAMLRAIATNPLNETVPEDVWYCTALQKLGAKLPNKTVATWFAVESYFYPAPLGLHKFHVFFGPGRLGKEREQILSYCPEARIIIPNT